MGIPKPSGKVKLREPVVIRRESMVPLDVAQYDRQLRTHRKIMLGQIAPAIHDYIDALQPLQVEYEVRVRWKTQRNQQSMSLILEVEIIEHVQENR